ncbi:MAG: hypothetical protein NVS3B26_27750 [Mycobacteriales bacterium]
MKIVRVSARLAMLAAMSTVIAGVAATPALAKSPSPSKPVGGSSNGCPKSNPTAIGGDAIGSDGYTLNELIGLDLRDSSGNPVDINGNPISGGYGYVDHINTTLSADGAPSGGVRRWGVNDGTGNDLCVAKNVATVYAETYPKDQNGVTTKTRYGAGSRYGVSLSPGGTYHYALDLPLRYDLGGITGDVAGTITYNGGPVSAAQITRMRAFSKDAGLSCEPGISGFSAHYDSLSTATGASSTNVLLGYLAGGRCGQASQTYSVYLDCTCGGSVHTLQADVAVITGTTHQVTWAFSDTGDTVTVA